MNSPFRFEGYIQPNQSSHVEATEPKTESKEPLLPQHISNESTTSSAWFENRRAATKRSSTFGFHLGLIAIYTIAALSAISYGSSRECRYSEFEVEQQYSPAHEAARYKTVIHSNWNGDPYEKKYRGGPSPEVDSAWDELLKPYNLRISPEELHKLNKTSLPLHDGSGDYMASMEIYHHLHCLNMMRHWMARDYYHDTMEHEKMHISPGHIYPSHIEHCLDMLRQHLMCSPSLSFWTYSWREENDFKEPSDDMHFQHRCVVWDALHAWANERAFELEAGVIHRPDGRKHLSRDGDVEK